jgi:hypothetical protein
VKDPTVYGGFLWLFTVLLLGRVLGQIIVALRAPRWLPPMEQWQSGLLPYPALLAGQAVVLVLMVWIFFAAFAAFAFSLYSVFRYSISARRLSSVRIRDQKSCPPLPDPGR